MHEHGYGEGMHHGYLEREHEHEHEVMHHLPEVHYGPQAHDTHELIEEGAAVDQASWRDDKYHDHAGFDLSPRHHEREYEGDYDNERHHTVSYGHHDSYLQ